MSTFPLGALGVDNDKWLDAIVASLPKRSIERTFFLDRIFFCCQMLGMFWCLDNPELLQ